LLKCENNKNTTLNFFILIFYEKKMPVQQTPLEFIRHMSLLREVTNAVYTMANFWSGFGYVGITVGIFIGGMVVWFGLHSLIQWLALGDQRATKCYFVKKDPKTGKPLYWNISKSWVITIRHVVQLFTVTIFFCGVFTLVWLGSAMAGVDPTSAALTNLGITVIATYIFITPLSMIGCGLWILLTGYVMVGDYVMSANLGREYEGKVVAIYIMYVILERFDSEANCAELVKIPNHILFGSPTKTNMVRAFNYETLDHPASKPACEFDAVVISSSPPAPPQQKAASKQIGTGIRRRYASEEIV
jgi:hypothetical protein